MPLKEDIEREIYLTMAAEEHWTKKTLRSKINGMLIERTVISDKPKEFIKVHWNSRFGFSLFFQPQICIAKQVIAPDECPC